MDSHPLSLARVTIVLNALHGGGAEHVGRTWAEELRRQGHPCRLLVLEAPTESDLAKLRADVRFECVDRRAGWQSWWRLRRELRRDRADMVVSLQMPANLALLLLMATVPRKKRALLAISERNIVSIDAETPSARHRVKVRVARRLYRRADRMIAISHPVAAEMVAHFGVPSERCAVVPNPAALTPGAHHRQPRRAAAQDSDSITLVLAGRVSPQKRPLLVVAVAQLLNERGTRTTVRVYGDGPLLASLRAEAHHRRVVVEERGWVEGWPEDCPDDSVLLLPSIKEGFGNVLVEAASWRIPSVAVSGALGVADALVPGVTGALAVSHDPRALARAVLQARACTFAGVDEWLPRFTPEQSVGVLMEVLSYPRGGPACHGC